MPLLTVLVGLAAAQGLPNTSGNVQLLHPSVDARRTLWTDDSGGAPSRSIHFRTLLSYTARPLLWQRGDTIEAVVGSTWRLDVLGSATLGPVRLGLDVPLLIGGASDVFRQGAVGFGDVALDGRVRLVDPGSAGLGVAITSRVDLSTANVAAPLGGSGPSVEVASVIDYRTSGLFLAGNVGAWVGPPIVLGNTVIGNRLVVRGGLGVPVVGAFGISADVAASLAFGVPVSVGLPVEAVLGGWLESGPWTVHAGAGRGFSTAVGSPAARVLVSLSYDPALKLPRLGGRGSGGPDREGSAVTVTRISPEVDADGDGVADAHDDCPNEPEDADGYRDEDGCPDPVVLGLRVQDASGALVHGAFTWVQCGDIEARLPAHGRVQVPAGSCTVNVAAPGWTLATESFDVADGPPHERSIVLAPEGPMGRIEVAVADSRGAPVPQALWSLGEDPTRLPVPTGHTALAVKPGTYALRIEALGFEPQVHTLEVTTGGVARVDVTLWAEQ